MSCDFTFSHPPFCLICNDSVNLNSHKTSDSTSSSSIEAEELNLLQVLCKWVSVISNNMYNNQNEVENEQQSKSSQHLDKSKTNSSSSSVSSPSFFCPKCKTSVEKLNKIQQQIESIKLEMSAVVTEILSTVINSCPISKEPHPTQLKNKNKMVNSKQREFLKMRQQICEYFCPSLADTKVEESSGDDDLTSDSDDEMNELKFERDLSNDYEFSHESEQEEESKPPTVFHSPSPQFNCTPDVESKSPINFAKSPPKRKKTEIKNPISSLNAQKVQQKPSSSFSSLIKAKLTQNTKKLAVSPKSYKTLKKKIEEAVKSSDSASGFPPFLLNHPKRDKIKIEGDGKYLYKNKFRFENIPGTTGQKCLFESCQVLTKSFDAMLTHLRQHEPDPPKHRIRKGYSGSSSCQSHPPRKRPLLTLDCGNGEYLTDGKYRFRKVDPDSPISSPNPNPKGEKEKPEKFLCDTCGHYTNTRTQMSSHIRDVHAIPLLFVCQICSKEFHLKSNYEAHLATHSETPTEICHVCGVGFKRKDRLLDHMNEHLNIQFNCPRENCGQTFKNKPALKRHLKYHNGEKKFLCTQCGKCFVRPKSLRNHVTNFHDQIRFVCSIGNCGKKFRYRANLRRHQRTVDHEKKSKRSKNKGENNIQ